MRYGTVPIVRNTGGLADSVVHFNVERARRGEDQPGTGFVFEHSTAAGLTWAIEQALEVWQHPASWRALQQRGMAQDMSWRRRVADYETLYQRVMDL
jgi:starch synthase